MKFTPRIDNAVRLASHLHRHQYRKDNLHTPYVSHLYSVGLILASVTDDEDIVIAGLMHDSLEDVPNYTYEMLATDCGRRVAEIVKYVTEPLDASKEVYEQLPWLERKEAYLLNLEKGGEESALVSAADKIHNTESFIEDVAREGKDFLARFDSSLENKIIFHERVLAIIESKLAPDHPLIVRLRKCTADFRNLIDKKEALV